MAETITVTEVRNLTGTALPDYAIEGYISIVDGADECLDANNVPAAQQKLLKIYGAAHFVAMDSLGDGVKSKSSPHDSITYKDGARDVTATKYGRQLQALDTYGCVTTIIAPRGEAFFGVISGDC